MRIPYWVPLAACTVGVASVLYACTSDPQQENRGTPILTPEAGADDSGADAGNPLAPDWKSGSRLRAMVQSADGAGMRVGWYDSLLKARCTFEPASNSQLSCVPQNDWGDFLFSDAACTTPIVKPSMQPGATAPAPYVYDSRIPFTCGTGEKLYLVGAKQATPTTVYSKDGGGSCIAAAANATAAYYALGPALDPATLVGGTAKEEARGKFISVGIIEGADGAREEHHLIDQERHVRCIFAEGATTICYPKDLAYAEFFSDATCATKLAYHPEYSADSCTPPVAIVESTISSQACSDTLVLHFYSVGTKAAPPVYYMGSTCKSAPVPNLSTLYTLGAPIANPTFPSLAATKEGPGRIQLEVARAQDGFRVASLHFFDSKLQKRCFPDLTADKKLRCLPVPLADLTRYSDAACGAPLMEILRSPGCPSPTFTGTVAVRTVTGEHRYYPLAGKVTPAATIYEFTANKCNAIASLANADYYSVGAEIPPTEYVEIVEATE